MVERALEQKLPLSKIDAVSDILFLPIGTDGVIVNDDNLAVSEVVKTGLTRVAAVGLLTVTDFCVSYVSQFRR